MLSGRCGILLALDTDDVLVTRCMCKSILTIAAVNYHALRLQTCRRQGVKVKVASMTELTPMYSMHALGIPMYSNIQHKKTKIRLIKAFIALLSHLKVPFQ
jgi:hypothetical protein